MEHFFYFPSGVYRDHRPEFLGVMRTAAERHLTDTPSACSCDPHSLYPVAQSENFAQDSSIAEFSRFVTTAAWDVLRGQGYNMQGIATAIEAMWLQRHFKSSSMEQHVHGGVQLVGFYVLRAPAHCSRVIFHDPRPAKVILSLEEANISEVSPASQAINFELHEGDLLLTNAWLPHSFTRNGADSPLDFIHLNIAVRAAPIAEVI